MKKGIKIVGTVFLAVYVLFISSGFTISHVYCTDGEKWFVGKEMPTCEYSSDSETSNCKSKKNCPKTSKKNDRKKDTFDLKFEIEGLEVSSPKFVILSLDSFLGYTVLMYDFGLFSDINFEKNLFGFLSPSDILKPVLTELQVFRI
ncbi:hypothetical protein N9544_07345 [Flavobacteriales bacterium]|nr:hypothetical protein [Flavobacteriales bacterium]